MKHDSIRDVFREGIVEKSIQILRNHGKSDDEIKEMMIKDFSISDETIDMLLKTQEL